MALRGPVVATDEIADTHERLRSMNSTSVVIPAHNAEEFLAETLSSILANSTPLEIIVVDDGSDDATFEVLTDFARRHPNLTALAHTRSMGAGAARNTGLRQAKGKYVCFLDADDIVMPGAIDCLVGEMEASDCDVLAFKYKYLFMEGEALGGMVGRDEKIWRNYVGSRPFRDAKLRDIGEILLTVNYPWNKFLRLDFCRQTNLFFSDTAVNNDVYAHWHAYLHAGSIRLFNQALVHHRVFADRNQITNVFDKRRFDVFRAFEDVERLFDRQPELVRQYYRFFLDFKLDLIRWVYDRLEADLRPLMRQHVAASYHRYDMKAYLDMFEINPQVATQSAYLKNSPESILK